MKSLIALALSLATLSLPAHSAQVSVPGVGVTFDAPDGFTPMTRDEIAVKFRRSFPPSFAVGSEGRTTMVAFNSIPKHVPAEQLSAVKSQLEKEIEGLRVLVWKERKFIDVQGQRSIYFEFWSRVSDTDVVNMMVFIPFNGQVFLFNFATTKGDFPKMESKLRDSLKSIKLK